jgi:hypothetical protein
MLLVGELIALWEPLAADIAARDIESDAGSALSLSFGEFVLVGQSWWEEHWGEILEELTTEYFGVGRLEVRELPADVREFFLHEAFEMILC